MLRNSSFSEFYHQKRLEERASSVQSVVEGSLAEEIREEKVSVICRRPSRTWWEQSWFQSRRYR